MERDCFYIASTKEFIYSVLAQMVWPIWFRKSFSLVLEGLIFHLPF